MVAMFRLRSIRDRAGHVLTRTFNVAAGLGLPVTHHLDANSTYQRYGWLGIFGPRLMVTPGRGPRLAECRLVAHFRSFGR